MISPVNDNWHQFNRQEFILNLYYLYLMGECLPLNSNRFQANCKTQRLKHINAFFLLKQSCDFISRQTLFLAIAICQKYLKTFSQCSLQDQFDRKRQVRIYACIWLAMKFMESNMSSIRKLISSLLTTDTKTQTLVEMEHQILEKIDFEIPSEITYVSLSRQFECHSKQRQCQAVLAGQCLRFLKEALKYSSDFSLCAQLGPKIVQLFQSKLFSDCRIKQAYMMINKKTQPSLNTAEVR